MLQALKYGGVPKVSVPLQGSSIGGYGDMGLRASQHFGVPYWKSLYEGL